MSSIKIRSKLIDGDTQIRLLISHPMEHGRNRDKTTNELIPAHFIQELTVSLNQKVLVSCAMGPSVSKDPYFAFMLKGGKAGDEIGVAWVDNLGNKDAASHIVK